MLDHKGRSRRAARTASSDIRRRSPSGSVRGRIRRVTAQKILDNRNDHGAFSSVDELDSVPGIGPARLAELKNLVDL